MTNIFYHNLEFVEVLLALLVDAVFEAVDQLMSGEIVYLCYRPLIK